MLGINRRSIVVLHDLAMCAAAWLLAWFVRFNLDFPYYNWELSLKLLPGIIVIQGIIFWHLGLYRGLWRFSSLPDLWNIVKAAIIGTFALLLVLFILLRLEGIPRTIVVLYPAFLILLLGGPRLIYRVWRDNGFKPVSASINQQRVLIIGAGRAGEALARDLLREGHYYPVGFLDDDIALRGAQVHGLPVLGDIKLIRQVVEQQEIDLIVIAIPTATGQQMRRIVELCEQVQCPMRTLPGLQDIVDGRPGISDLRDISIEDLLGREKINLDWQLIKNSINDQVVLVSGGGGSIGAELCRQIVSLNPKRLIILERSEFNLYRIYSELTERYPDSHISILLGDVCDVSMLDRVLSQYKPDIIFHAAAHKHVPLLERQVREAVKNNLLGTMYIGNAAIRHGCKKFVLISTDKAVNPGNILGKTKRLAELLCDNLNQKSETAFITVRFGNVLGTDGSVVPLFQEQIRSGGPVTLTHPDMQRYFMTISESCQLILQAGAMGRGGEIFVLDMGQPVKICYLAEQMIRLSGRTPGRDIEIQVTGLRPGEKITEELFHESESPSSTLHPKIMLARHHSEQNIDLDLVMAELVQACIDCNEARLVQLINSLLPHAITERADVIPIRTTGVVP